MGKLVDFKCEYANYTGIDKSFVASLGLKLPEMYQNAADMASYAKAVRQRDQGLYCKLPFDTAVEAENLGSILKYDDSPLGPRKDGDAIQDAKDILDLPKLDPTKGRMAEILKACDLLRAEGETVLIEIRGLFDIMNALVDIQKILMVWAMEPDMMQKICDKIREDLVIYFKAAKDHCDLLFYSDASGGINVIGPRCGKQLVKWFTYPLMKDLLDALEGGPALQVCPKVAFMLTGCDKAVWKRYEVEEQPYMNACLTLPNEIRFLGQRCSRNLAKNATRHIDYFELSI